jgi:tetratricopeptide (TPR) repeat protein
MFPALLPYAAQQLVLLRRCRTWRIFKSWQGFALLAVVAALVPAVAMIYPVDWAVRNLRRGWAVQQAEWALNTGDTTAALKQYRQANVADPGSADVWLAIGRVYQRLDEPQQALAAYENAFAQMPSYVTVNLMRGDALRRLGRLAEARQAFEGFYNDPQHMLDWAWTQLDPPLPEHIAVGDGLDFGFVAGMYPAEMQQPRQVRWTQQRAAMRLGGSTAGARIGLVLAAPRPDRERVPVQICVNAACQNLMLDAQWRRYRLTAVAAQQYHVTITAPTFRPRQFDSHAKDERQLGVLVDEVTIDAFTP